MIPIHKLTGRLGNQMFQFAYLWNEQKKGNIPDIYLQDPKFFEESAEEIKQMFSQGIGGYLPYVSIHVRRGDYVGNPFHVDLSATDYFDRAIAMFPDAKFLVFSDDTEWCKGKFSDPEKFQVMEGQTEIEDLNMMASCRDNIISNSTFSWWAAYLNPNWSKKVIVPKADMWFHDGVARVGLPKEWTQIEYEKA